MVFAIQLSMKKETKSILRFCTSTWQYTMALKVMINHLVTVTVHALKEFFVSKFDNVTSKQSDIPIYSHDQR